MNYLAHCALAQAHPELIVGGYLGDFIKGPVPDHLPGQIGNGVRLHRRLDAYSAEQPDIRRSVMRLPSELLRFAPVFVDLVADHFLARRFHAEEGQPLDAFAAQVYAILDDRRALYPEPARRFLDSMRQHDLLCGYTHRSAVERAFQRIAMRLRRRDIVAPAMASLNGDYEGFEADFAAYYPDLKRHAAGWLARRAPAHHAAG